MGVVIMFLKTGLNRLVQPRNEPSIGAIKIDNLTVKATSAKLGTKHFLVFKTKVVIRDSKGEINYWMSHGF